MIVALAALAPGITPEMAAAVSKLMRNQDLILVAKKCRVVTAFRNTLGLPGRLADVGVGKDRFREIAEKSMHDRAVLNNPRPIKGPAEVMEILDLAA